MYLSFWQGCLAQQEFMAAQPSKSYISPSCKEMAVKCFMGNRFWISGRRFYGSENQKHLKSCSRYQTKQVALVSVYDPSQSSWEQ